MLKKRKLYVLLSSIPSLTLSPSIIYQNVFNHSCSFSACFHFLFCWFNSLSCFCYQSLVFFLFSLNLFVLSIHVYLFNTSYFLDTFIFLFRLFPRIARKFNYKNSINVGLFSSFSGRARINSRLKSVLNQRDLMNNWALNAHIGRKAENLRLNSNEWKRPREKGGKILSPFHIPKCSRGVLFAFMGAFAHFDVFYLITRP